MNVRAGGGDASFTPADVARRFASFGRSARRRAL